MPRPLIIRRACQGQRNVFAVRLRGRNDDRFSGAKNYSKEGSIISDHFESASLHRARNTVIYLYGEDGSSTYPTHCVDSSTGEVEEVVPVFVTKGSRVYT